jgi:cytochrome c-type biogenesis protein CcmH/NrfG
MSAHYELVTSGGTPVQLQACLQAAARALHQADRLEEAELACLAWLQLEKDTMKLAGKTKVARQHILGAKESAVWMLLASIYAKARHFQDAEAAFLVANKDATLGKSASLTELLVDALIQQGKHKVRWRHCSTCCTSLLPFGVAIGVEVARKASAHSSKE